MALARLCFSAFLNTTLAAQTIVQTDFEDGTVQGWIPRGPVTLANTEEVPAHGGTHSLKTTGRTQGFHGPSLNVFGVVTKGATYQVTAWVRLVAGEVPTQIRVTVQRTVSGSNSRHRTPLDSLGFRERCDSRLDVSYQCRNGQRVDG